MNKTLSTLLFFTLAPSLYAQGSEFPNPSSASHKYSVYRHERTQPLYGVNKVNGLINSIKRNDMDNLPLSQSKFKALTVREKFAYVMLHGEDFSQNCDAMPPMLDEHKKVFAYFPSPFSGDMVWSERQRAFLVNNRKIVVSMLRELMVTRKRVGVNIKQGIMEIKANELIPDVIGIYKRDKKDHDILTLLMLLMEEAKYQPFLSSKTHTLFYGENSNYQSFLPANSANEKLIIDRATSFYKSRKK